MCPGPRHLVPRKAGDTLDRSSWDGAAEFRGGPHVPRAATSRPHLPRDLTVTCFCLARRTVHAALSADTEEGTGTVWGPGPVARLLPPRPWTCQSPSLGMTDFQVGGLEQKAVFQHFFFKQQKPFLSLLKKDASLFLPGLPGGMKSLPRRRPEVGQGSLGSPERSGSLRAGGITFLPMRSSREAAERTPRLGSCHQALTVA